MEGPMNKMIVLMSACAVLTTFSVVDAQDTPRDDKAKTQGDIMNERAHACEGLKGPALQQCLDNYVGPARDANSGAPESAAAPEQKNQSSEQKSKEQADGAEHDGSTQVDTMRSNKRAPVGPIKSGPGEKKQ
jgi:hypothetical protein